MTWLPDAGLTMALAVTGGLVHATILLFRTGRLLGRIEEKLEDHDRRLEALEERTRVTARYLDSR